MQQESRKSGLTIKNNMIGTTILFISGALMTSVFVAILVVGFVTEIYEKIYEKNWARLSLVIFLMGIVLAFLGI